MKKNIKTSREERELLLERNRKKILTSSSPYAIREAYVQLRTSLMFSVAATEGENCKVFAVTSPNASEGKSLTSTNIAISFAMLGKKTLLIDADMRRPNLHSLWNISCKNGLSNLLTNVDVCNIKRISEIPLSIITSGDIPPNPSELLSSPAFEKQLSNMRKDYDFIIIDTPPVNFVADTQIISQHVDGVVIVAHCGSTKLNDIARAEENLKKAGSKICGILVNDINTRTSKYSYHYNNYYKNQYYQGYETREDTN